VSEQVPTPSEKSKPPGAGAGADADADAGADVTLPAPPSRLVTFRRMRTMEAQLAKAKLESEGVRCFIADENINVAHPFLWSEVTLQVPELELGRAAEILDRPAEDDDEGEYVDEEYRCPKCHRREVDLMPLSPRWRATRFGCLALLGAPILVGVIDWAGVELSRRIGGAGGGAVLWGWLIATVLLSMLVLLAKRRKRCRKCGHVWSGSGVSPSDARDAR
jgi:hypothetical protein